MSTGTNAFFRGYAADGVTPQVEARATVVGQGGGGGGTSRVPGTLSRQATGVAPGNGEWNASLSGFVFTMQVSDTNAGGTDISSSWNGLNSGHRLILQTTNDTIRIRISSNTEGTGYHTLTGVIERGVQTNIVNTTPTTFFIRTGPLIELYDIDNSTIDGLNIDPNALGDGLRRNSSDNTKIEAHANATEAEFVAKTNTSKLATIPQIWNGINGVKSILAFVDCNQADPTDTTKMPIAFVRRGNTNASVGGYTAPTITTTGDRRIIPTNDGYWELSTGTSGQGNCNIVAENDAIDWNGTGMFAEVEKPNGAWSFGMFAGTNVDTIAADWSMYSSNVTDGIYLSALRHESDSNPEDYIAGNNRWSFTLTGAWNTSAIPVVPTLASYTSPHNSSGADSSHVSIRTSGTKNHFNCRWTESTVDRIRIGIIFDNLRIHLMVNQFSDSIIYYVGHWEITAAQRDAITGKYFGFNGDTNNSTQLKLYNAYVGPADIERVAHGRYRSTMTLFE